MIVSWEILAEWIIIRRESEIYGEYLRRLIRETSASMQIY